MGKNSHPYDLVLLLHVGLVVVGFGSNFVVSFLTARARGLAAGGRAVLTSAAAGVARALVTGPVIAAGVVGVVLVPLSDGVYTFAQVWVSLAFLLYFGIVAVMLFLISPNAREMDELTDRLARGEVTASTKGGPPREAVELDERDKRAAAFTGIVHLLWLLTMIDMIWRPGA